MPRRLELTEDTKQRMALVSRYLGSGKLTDWDNTQCSDETLALLEVWREPGDDDDATVNRLAAAIENKINTDPHSPDSSRTN